MLTLWRNKLRARERPQRIFDAVREVIDATNILAGKTRRALDSTVLDDAVTRQDAIMQLVAQIRRVRRLVPAAKALELVATTTTRPRQTGVRVERPGRHRPGRHRAGRRR